MLWALQTLVQDGEDLCQVTGQKRGRIEPEAGEDRAAEDPIRRERHRLVSALAKDEPVDLPVEHAPDDVFADAIAAIDVSFSCEVVAGAAGGDLGDKLGRALDVIVFADRVPGRRTPAG